mgnify:FL=1|tara:strand:+ start:591 stop:1154 length:564 start_codon:yes stop_codon:yes gene_type:complete
MTDIMYSTEWQEHKEKHELHECSCGDTKINHAHEFPELGCYCVTCEHTKETTVMFDEEVIKNLKHIKDIIKDMKTKFDHVRGDVEAREIMSATIDRTIEIIKLKIESKGYKGLPKRFTSPVDIKGKGIDIRKNIEYKLEVQKSKRGTILNYISRKEHTSAMNRKIGEDKIANAEIIKKMLNTIETKS